MFINYIRVVCILLFIKFLGVIDISGNIRAQYVLTLKNDQLELIWKKHPEGWKLDIFNIMADDKWVSIPNPSGQNTLLYTAEQPDSRPAQLFYMNTGQLFPEELYNHKKPQWEETINAVSLNTAGEAFFYYFSKGRKIGSNRLQFEHENSAYKHIVEWWLDPDHHNDIKVSQKLMVKKAGYYSLSSPTLYTIDENNLAWATVPGYFQGKEINKDFVQAYAYGMGIPELPAVFRDRCASTLCPLVTSKSGITYSVIPDPGYSRDPWANDRSTLSEWNIGLSHKNRKSEFAPTLYFPVLGEPQSLLKRGDSVRLDFRYSIIKGNWFEAINHAVYDVYQFKEALALRQSKQSLTDRVEKMHHYLRDPVTSMWNIEAYKNMSIGAQSYLGGAMGATNDAMKNSDYGAMWFLAHSTGDTILLNDVLPYALNFKLAQQIDTGFFKGAIEGQYYLARQKRFVEEWGSVVEPIGVTYYTMLDIGNILLFDPENEDLTEKLKLGAEFLLRTQKSDGSWEVAYDHSTQSAIFKDIPDLRPTFYGLLVAYRLLKEKKYLDAACKGADWFITHAVNAGSFLGVCGDARYSPDFATGQSAQALLDLFDITKTINYKNGAIAAAKIYVNSIYTHPLSTKETKYVKGKPVEDWQITQAGLSFEHGGIFGSANRAGPILLCSHAGLFIRMFELTGEPIFADMARAGAIGRDAFVDPKTSVASYYWNTMNRGAGPYPHHAWWQVGWITDYLLAEAQLRSKGEIIFPRGFVTPKVGPHQTVGFAPGSVYGDSAKFFIKPGFVHPDHPAIDYILAKSVVNDRVYIILQNNRSQETSFRLDLFPHTLKKEISRIRRLPDKAAFSEGALNLTIAGFSQEVIALDLLDI